MKDEVRKWDGREHLSRADVPDDNLAVAARTEKDIIRRRMPGEKAYPSLMANQLDDGLGERPREAIVGNLPHLHGGVLRGAGNDVVVKGTPLDVEDGAFVPGNQWVIYIYAAGLRKVSGRGRDRYKLVIKLVILKMITSDNNI